MDENEFKERASRLQDVGKIIEKLPTEIRSEAFSLLKGYVSDQASSSGRKTNPAEDSAKQADDGDFFGKYDHDKPSDNARLVAAYLFREYGAAPFSTEDLKSIASSVGITLPDRVDVTIGAAQEKGKHLFARVGRGKFKPTVHGESFLKATYNVKKGTKTRQDNDK